jgi:outer membrane protein assembly factor BamB
MESTETTRELRLWPGVVVVALQWVAVFGTGLVAPATVVHFFGMVGGPLVGALLLALWWLFFSRASWTDRIGGIVAPVVCFLVTQRLVHETAGMALVVFGIPVLCLAFVAALLVTRRWPAARRRWGVAAVLVLACAFWMTVRTNGVDGALNVDFAWRWSATSEETFLASSTAAAEPGAVSEAGIDVDGPSWPEFRGSERNSRVTGVALDPDWNGSPPEELWRRPIGPGWSSFAVVGDRLFTQEQRGEDEVVSCYSAATGDPLWVHRDRARFWESLAGAGPRATPTFHEGRVYAYGATGILNCLDAADGSPIWSRDVTVDSEATVPDWGFASSPLVVDDLVIVFAGGADGKGVAAYDRATGEPRWFAPTGQLSYSSPQLASIDAIPQILILTGDGATGLSPEDGAVFWEHAWPLSGGARIVQPGVLDGGRVLIGTGFGQGVRLVTVSLQSGAWTVDEGWTSRNLKPYYNDFVAHREHLFGFDGSILACIDLETGARQWKRGRSGNGQLLLIADQNLLLVLSERGEIVLVNADPEAFEELARMPAIAGKTWNHPVLVEDRLFVRNGEEAAAFRLPTSGSRALARR